MKTSRHKTSLTQTAEEYAGRSSIHGMGYIFDREPFLLKYSFIFTIQSKSKTRRIQNMTKSLTGLLMSLIVYSGCSWCLPPSELLP